MRKVPLTGTSNTFTNSNTEICATGFRPETNPNGKKCMTMAAMGCSFITRNFYGRAGNIQCPKNAKFNEAANEDDPGVCARNANIVDVKSEGDFCGYNNANRNQVCGHNLICGETNRCKKRSDVGGECGTHNSGCLHGLLCVNYVCIKPFSLPDNAPCLTNSGTATFNEACESGYCGESGVCGKTASKLKCWKNLDCASSPNSACVGVKGNQPGECLAIYNIARGDWLRCIYDKCREEAMTHDELQKCMTTGMTYNGDYNEYCSKSYARYMCSQYCTKSPDARNTLLYGGESFVELGETPFKFNCKEQTVSRLDKDSDCNISNFFSSCDAIIDYPSASSHLQISMLLALSLSLIYLIIF